MKPHVPEELAQGPFTPAQAAAAGVTKHALRSACWRRVLTGVWVHVDVPDTLELRLAAARLALPPHAVLCDLTAAWVYAGDVRPAGSLDMHVCYPTGRRRRPQPGLVVREEALAPADIWLTGNVRITSPVRTAFDCLRLLRGDLRLVVADALAARSLFTLEELAAYFTAQRRLRNLRIGAALVGSIEPKTESPRETRLRLLLIRHGLPRPVAQWEVRDAAGAFVARLDLAPRRVGRGRVRRQLALGAAA